jgi:hypothetical protein
MNNQNRFLKQLNPEINGLNGNETNPRNTTDSKSENITVNPFAEYVDPGKIFYKSKLNQIK